MYVGLYAYPFLYKWACILCLILPLACLFKPLPQAPGPSPVFSACPANQSPWSNPSMAPALPVSGARPLPHSQNPSTRGSAQFSTCCSSAPAGHPFIPLGNSRDQLPCHSSVKPAWIPPGLDKDRNVRALPVSRQLRCTRTPEPPGEATFIPRRAGREPLNFLGILHPVMGRPRSLLHYLARKKIRF